MRLISTADAHEQAPISAAILSGAAPDGGLYAPEPLPRLDLAALDPGAGLPRLAHALLAPFFSNDPLASALEKVCASVFDFPCPLVPVCEGFSALELFHGPTGAFKDFGARFLMAMLGRLMRRDRPLTILVATSGDTGGAVGHAAESQQGPRTLILYPHGRVSEFQEHQLSCWRAPVQAIRVRGDFDACQALVKQAFADRALLRRYGLTSANSINIARLLPQMVYWAWAALTVRRTTGQAPGLIVPTGNLGNAVAALYARALGLPIGPVILATNANATLADWASSGRYDPRPSIATLANAMDVGAPSNFARLQRLAGAPGLVRVERVEDAAIRARIKADFDRFGYVWCPHSACAADAYARLDASDRSRPWLAGATAHPFKFANVVEPLIGQRLHPPPPLAAVLDRPAQAIDLPRADLNSLAGILAT